MEQGGNGMAAVDFIMTAAGKRSRLVSRIVTILRSLLILLSLTKENQRQRPASIVAILQSKRECLDEK